MTETETEWTYPLDMIEQGHRNRVDPELPQQPFMVECWHKDRPVPSWICQIGFSETIEARDAMLHAVQVMALTCAPDFITFAYDTHMSMSPMNPTTGKPWESHEMQRMCDEEGYCETGVITDNMVVHTLRMSDGKSRMKCFPYHVEDGKVIHYDEAVKVMGDMDGGEMLFTGIIPDAIKETFQAASDPNNPTTLLLQAGTALGMDREAVRLHSVLAGVKVLAAAGLEADSPGLFHSILLATTPEEAEIVQASAARGIEKPSDAEREAMESIMQTMREAQGS